MSAFGSPWEDIDQTRPGQPYVVDSDGWGWFMLFILLAVPFAVLGAILAQLAETICAHPYITICVYLLFACILSLVLNTRGNRRHRVLGVISTMLTLLPFIQVQMLYMIPYLLQNSLFSAAFEWLIVTAAMVGLTFFILAICNVLQNRLVQLLLALLFLALTCLILFLCLSSSKEINWAVVQTLYRW